MNITKMVRAYDPATSVHAAEKAAQSEVKARKGASVRATVVAVLAEHPDGLTHDEIYERFMRIRPASPSGVRSRVNELRDEGYVRDTGRTRPSALGTKHAIVWALTEQEKEQCA